MRLGLLRSTRFIDRPFGAPLEVFRCETDGGIGAVSQSCLSNHLGHKVRQPVIVKPHELLMIWLRLIK